jgi:hypothetical protein
MGKYLAVMLGIIALFLAIGPFIVMALWAWVIPDIMPGAVASGAVVGHLAWWTAFKVMVFVTVMFGGNAVGRKHN